MKKLIQKIGREKTVLLITFISLVLAIVLDLLLAKVLQHQFIQTEIITRVVIITLILIPMASWHLLGVYFDLEKLENDIKNLATHDELTGLLNRDVFFRSCDKLHKIALRNKQNYCILAIDMDDFKKINKKYGHATGDKVLAIFGELSHETVRDSDILARLGGEEFAFFLPNTNIEQAETLSLRLCEKVRKKAVINENKYIQYTVSIGIASNLCEGDQTMEQTLKMANESLNDAKEQGGNITKTYSAE